MKKRTVLLAPMLALVLLISILQPQVVYADDTYLVFEGVEIGDTIEVYKICNYDAQKASYTWVAPVANLVSEKNAYQGLTPVGLKKMKEEAAKDFCYWVLLSLKDEATGTARLNGSSFLVLEEKENYRMATEPGYYIVLPKGKERIYDVRFLAVKAEPEIVISYGEEDYYAPQVTSTITPSVDRGGLSEENYANKDLTLVEEGYDYPFLQEGDLVQVETEIVTKPYIDAFAKGKLIYIVSTVIPQGMEYVEDSMQFVEAEEAGEEGGDGQEMARAMEFADATMYCDYQGEPLFFEASGHFYYMRGEWIGYNNVEEAVATYNRVYGTSYVLPKPPVIAEEEEETEGIEGLAETEEAETEAAETTEAAEDLEEVTEINPDEPEEESLELVLKPGNTVLVNTLLLDQDYSDVRFTYEVQKNAECAKEGWYECYSVLSYSLSPLDHNLLGQVRAGQKAIAYGIYITACQGAADTYQLDVKETLVTAPRMTKDRFMLYRRVGETPGDMVGTRDEYFQIYDQTTGYTTNYAEVTELVVNDIAEVGVGGLVAGDYLIVQTQYTGENGLSQAALLIEEEDWSTFATMEGNGTMDFLWLDYPSYYLPATGEFGIENNTAKGILVGMFVFVAAAQFIRKKRTL